MKHVVILNDLKESDIRPEDIYAEYKKMTEMDIQKYFSDSKSLVEVSCPACSCAKYDRSMLVLGLTYRVCSSCSSWYVSPRPHQELLLKFNQEAPSAIFSQKQFSESSTPARSKEVLSYRLQWIQDLVEEHCPHASTFMDYGGKKYNVVKLLQKDWPLEENSVEVVSFFEQIERLFSPEQLIKEAVKGLKQGGIFLISTASSSGFEYKVLGQNAPSLHPIDRMNLLSYESILSVLEKNNLRVIEASTPGRLDVEIVKKVFLQNAGVIEDDFWTYFFKHRSDEACYRFQEFLQQFQLSSHVRIAAIKQ